MAKRRTVNEDEDTPRSGVPFAKFKKDLRIDQDSLDENYVDLPSLVQDAADELAFSISRRDKKKLELRSYIASLDGRLRTSMAKKEGRVTDTAVQKAIEADSEVQELESALIDANEEVSRLFGVKEALQVKANALDHLVKLHAASYFTKNGSREGAQDYDEIKAAHVRSVAGEKRRQRMRE